MGWWRFWDKDKDRGKARQPEVVVPEGRRTYPHDGTQPLPAPGRPPAPNQAARDQRRAVLARRREALLFDVEQGERALRPDNPWAERIALLGESLDTVAADRAALDALPPEPTHPVPPVPIAEVVATAGEQAEVSFLIGGERFRFAEEVDWDQRGGMVVRGDLRPADGEAAALVPADTPAALRAPLAAHLADSLFVFAADLRDRALAGEPLPDGATVADLARPCPEAGGWADWRGRCPARAARDRRRAELRAERERLEGERTREAEERHRLAERLPLARRRLADAEAELAALGE